MIIREPEKDLAWIIVLTSFLIFLFSSIISYYSIEQSQALPTPLTLAEVSLNRIFISLVLKTIRYAALAGMGLGFYGVLFWPPPPPD
jgi:hypothetical protein